MGGHYNIKLTDWVALLNATNEYDDNWFSYRTPISPPPTIKVSSESITKDIIYNLQQIGRQSIKSGK